MPRSKNDCSSSSSRVWTAALSPNDWLAMPAVYNIVRRYTACSCSCLSFLYRLRQYTNLINQPSGLCILMNDYLTEWKDVKCSLKEANRPTKQCNAWYNGFWALKHYFSRSSFTGHLLCFKRMAIFSQEPKYTTTTTDPIRRSTTARCTASEAEYICPMGFLCGWPVGVKFTARLHTVLVRSGSWQRHFLQTPIETFLFAMYWYVQRIRGFTTMCCKNLRLLTYLLRWNSTGDK